MRLLVQLHVCVPQCLAVCLSMLVSVCVYPWCKRPMHVFFEAKMLEGIIVADIRYIFTVLKQSSMSLHVFVLNIRNYIIYRIYNIFKLYIVNLNMVSCIHYISIVNTGNIMI